MKDAFRKLTLWSSGVSVIHCTKRSKHDAIEAVGPSCETKCCLAVIISPRSSVIVPAEKKLVYYNLLKVSS